MCWRPTMVRSWGIGRCGKLGVAAGGKQGGAFVRRCNAVHLLAHCRSRWRDGLSGPFKVGAFSGGCPPGREKC
jgi:hypothetical protein